MITKQPTGSGFVRNPGEKIVPGYRSAQQPPELSDLWKQLVKKLNRHPKSLSVGPPPSVGAVKGAGILVILLALLWGFWGLHTINEIERGVVTRFGRLNHIESPGLHWRAPFIDQVTRVDVGTIRALSTSGFMLTQDENVVRVEMNVQYRVFDPINYLFSVTDADNSLQQATDGALRYVIGHTTMDEILTRGRLKVRADTKQLLQQIIAAYDMGLEIIDVNFQQARPPEEVKAAFDDAIAAQEDQQRYIREAEAYARAREPRARGEAKRLEEEALAYKESVLLRARGEVDRFNELLPQYLKAPQIIRERLYIETLEQVLSKTPKVLLGEKSANSVMILPLEQLLQRSKVQVSSLAAEAPLSMVEHSVASIEKAAKPDNKQARYGR